MTTPRLSDDRFRAIANEFGTPCWVYDREEIDKRLNRLQAMEGFTKIRYAQKANSNTHLLRHLKSRGVVVDAVSLGEIERAAAAGYALTPQSDDVVYASDILDHGEMARISETGIAVNAGSPQMLEQIGSHSPGHRVWLRINPGFGSGFSRKTNTGGEFSKHGIWHGDLAQCYQMIEDYGLTLVGLHMHIGSGAEEAVLRRVCEAMVAQVKACPFDLEAVSTGGGLPITHRAEDVEFDAPAYGQVWSAAKSEIEAYLGHRIELEVEPGRYVIGNSGYLLSEVRAKKQMGENQFVLLNAGFNDLVRPAMYGGYHQLNIIPRNGNGRPNATRKTIVAGPLCEAGDVFTQNADGVVEFCDLPEPSVGSLAVFSDCGAYCASMSSNYNSRTLAPEILVEGESQRIIRKRQNFDDLLSLEDV
ncbi:diaminopimelate decarboxylase [Pelagibius sp. Alg239-R121]|uniref:diaminopimelate decarboxylase n=1 Tax=Pelagibius sp. Alg239-R121 TaxID=2993448 RepID=UPI0024A60B4D|nr:diaminopimelate decarboxylase [Pelagibius sp. Alg239-R121]